MQACIRPNQRADGRRDRLHSRGIRKEGHSLLEGGDANERSRSRFALSQEIDYLKVMVADVLLALS